MESTTATPTVAVGVGVRLVAVIIDAIVLYIVGLVIAAVTGNGDGASFSLNGASAILYFIIDFGYFIVMEKVWGATLGKMALGLRVVNANGSPLDWQASIVRNVLRIVDGFPYFIPYLVGAILVWTSPTKQRLGDRVANTLVVKKGTTFGAPSPTQRF